MMRRLIGLGRANLPAKVARTVTQFIIPDFAIMNTTSCGKIVARSISTSVDEKKAFRFSDASVAWDQHQHFGFLLQMTESIITCSRKEGNEHIQSRSTKSNKKKRLM